MKLLTDPRIVERRALERTDQYWDFRAHLKMSELSDAALDAIVHELLEEVSRSVDCQQCANCCRKIGPLLTDADVSRLSSGLGLSESECAAQYLKAADEPNGYDFASLPCPLLVGNSCSAYEHRPEDCRSFPHLHKPHFRSRLIQVVQNCSVCPIVYNVYELLMADLWPDDPDRYF